MAMVGRISVKLNDEEMAMELAKEMRMNTDPKARQTKRAQGRSRKARS